MINGQKVWIFKNINSLSYSEEDKLDAIDHVVSNSCYQNITKDDMWYVLRWLVKRLNEQGECKNESE